MLNTGRPVQAESFDTGRPAQTALADLCQKLFTF